MNEQATPTPDASDLNKRVEGFNAELIPLLGKFKLGLGATAGLTPDGRIFARPQLFDDTKKEEEAEPEATAPAEESTAAPAPEISEG